MTGPLIILAIPAALIGLLGAFFPPFSSAFQHFLEGGAYREVPFNLTLALGGAILAIVGIVAAWMMYGARQYVAEPLERFGPSTRCSLAATTSTSSICGSSTSWSSGSATR